MYTYKKTFAEALVIIEGTAALIKIVASRKRYDWNSPWSFTLRRLQNPGCDRSLDQETFNNKSEQEKQAILNTVFREDIFAMPTFTPTKRIIDIELHPRRGHSKFGEKYTKRFATSLISPNGDGVLFGDLTGKTVFDSVGLLFNAKKCKLNKKIFYNDADSSFSWWLARHRRIMDMSAVVDINISEQSKSFQDDKVFGSLYLSFNNEQKKNPALTNLVTGFRYCDGESSEKVSNVKATDFSGLQSALNERKLKLERYNEVMAKLCKDALAAVVLPCTKNRRSRYDDIAHRLGALHKKFLVNLSLGIELPIIFLLDTGPKEYALVEQLRDILGVSVMVQSANALYWFNEIRKIDPSTNRILINSKSAIEFLTFWFFAMLQECNKNPESFYDASINLEKFKQCLSEMKGEAFTVCSSLAQIIIQTIQLYCNNNKLFPKILQIFRDSFGSMNFSLVKDFSNDKPRLLQILQICLTILKMHYDFQKMFNCSTIEFHKKMQQLTAKEQCHDIAEIKLVIISELRSCHKKFSAYLFSLCDFFSGMNSILDSSVPKSNAYSSVVIFQIFNLLLKIKRIIDAGIISEELKKFYKRIFLFVQNKLVQHIKKTKDDFDVRKKINVAIDGVTVNCSAMELFVKYECWEAVQAVAEKVKAMPDNQKEFSCALVDVVSHRILPYFHNIYSFLANKNIFNFCLNHGLDGALQTIIAELTEYDALLQKTSFSASYCSANLTTQNVYWDVVASLLSGSITDLTSDTCLAQALFFMLKKMQNSYPPNILRLIASCYVALTERYTDELTVFHAAIKNNHIIAFVSILQNVNDTQVLHGCTRSSTGETLVHFCIRYGSVFMLQKMIESNKEFVRQCLQQKMIIIDNEGEKANTSGMTSSVSSMSSSMSSAAAPTKTGYVPLELAVKEGKLDVVKVIAGNYASTAGDPEGFGYVLLEAAKCSNLSEIYDLLITEHVAVRSYSFDSEKKTAIHYAIINRDDDLLIKLLHNKNFINEVLNYKNPETHENVVHFCIRYGSLSMLQKIFQLNLDGALLPLFQEVTSSTQARLTPLELAVENEQWDMVIFLISQYKITTGYVPIELKSAISRIVKNNASEGGEVLSQLKKTPNLNGKIVELFADDCASQVKEANNSTSKPNLILSNSASGLFPSTTSDYTVLPQLPICTR